jgi:hypothetical protein
MAIKTTLIRLGAPNAKEGALLYRDGVLIAVLSRGELRAWRVEAAFDGRPVGAELWFRNLDAACKHFEATSN